MSTNHTLNYSLSQWQAADQVLRTDFNEDNARIEAALAGLEERVAALYNAVPNLAHQLGQLDILYTANQEKYLSQRGILYEPFLSSILYTCTGNITISNHKATLSGAGVQGTITMHRDAACPTVWRELRFWVHQTPGSVAVTINGVPMTKLRGDIDVAASSASCNCQEFFAKVPYSSKLEIVLALDTETYSSMTIHDCTLFYF